MATQRSGGDGRPYEVIIPLPGVPGSFPPVTRVRSTLVYSSLKALTDLGLADRYAVKLAESYRGAIRDLIAGSWISIDVATAHYRACDALGLGRAQQFDIGCDVGKKLQSTLLGGIAGLSKQAGATPWVFIGSFGRIYARLIVGGAVAVYKVAAKEALFDLYNVRLFELPYFANGFRGVVQSVCEIFCTKVYVKAEHTMSGGGKTTLIISWV